MPRTREGQLLEILTETIHELMDEHAYEPSHVVSICESVVEINKTE